MHRRLLRHASLARARTEALLSVAALAAIACGGDDAKVAHVPGTGGATGGVRDSGAPGTGGEPISSGGTGASGTGGAATCDSQHDSTNCGECGHSCLGAPCSAGACAPTALYEPPSVNNSGDLVIGDNWLFWVNAQGEVLRMPKNGGSSDVVAADGDRAVGLAYTPGTIFWANRFRGDIRAADLSSLAVRTVSTTNVDPSDLALDNDVLYVAERNAGQIGRVPTSGGQVEVLATGQIGAVRVAVDTTYVYWITFVSDGVVAKLDKSTKAVTVLADHQASPLSMTVLGEYVYWANYDAKAGAVSRVPRTGGQVSTLASAPNAMGVATDGVWLYWTAGDSLWRSRVDGSIPLRLAAGQTTPQDMALDATWIYWCDFQAGSVLRVAR